LASIAQRVWQIKGRVDALKVPNDLECVIVDVKTTSAGADYNTFSRQAASLNYHVSGGLVLPPCTAQWAAAGKAFYWIAVETSAPYRGGRLRNPHSDALAAWRSAR
jgi:hypothetical protein